MKRTLVHLRRDDGAQAGARGRLRGFSLVELLVVMAILLILATLTTIAAGRIGDDVRLSSGHNAVIAALGEARAIAVRTNNLVLVTFRVARVTDDPAGGQVTEVVVAEWTGVTQNVGGTLLDVYRPVPGVPPRTLPAGVQVAGPWTDTGEDYAWVTLPRLTGSTSTSEVGRAIAVMFGRDGSLITRNPNGALGVPHACYVDYDGDGVQDLGLTGVENPQWSYDELGDECNLNPVQFLAVFDEKDARERYDTSQWSVNDELRIADITEYVTQFADRINFNLYTGAVVR